MKGRKPEIREENKSKTVLDLPPDWLSEQARVEWSRVMPILTERRILTDADLGNLENYCICIGRVREMEAAIQIENDTEVMLKLARLQDKSIASARQLAAELGLTPVSRSRPAMREDPEEGDDPLNVS